MHRTIREALAARGGAVTVTDLAALGVSRHVVDRAVRDGRLLRLRRNLVADAGAWRRLAPSERHAARARAVLGSLPAGTGAVVALSHHSSLAVHGLPLLEVDDRVHLVRTDGRRGRTSSLVSHHPPVPPSALSTAGGATVVTAALACLQVADAFGPLAGLVPADAALSRGAISRDGLRSALREGRFGRGRRAAATVAETADGRSESPGETRARWVMHLAGLPAPELQHRVTDQTGLVVARVDFLFAEHRTVVEFDGLVKYGGATGRDELAREKAREDRLRSLGLEVVRLTWTDLDDPRRVRDLVVAAFRRRAQWR